MIPTTVRVDAAAVWMVDERRSVERFKRVEALRYGMTDHELRKEAHDLDVTVWVGKSGLQAVTDELTDQLEDRKLVKVKFLRAARGTSDTEELAEELAKEVNAELVETRGNTAVLH